MLRKTLFILCLLFVLRAEGHQSYRELAGFALGQWKSIPSATLGKPYLSDTTENGVSYEAFHHPMGANWTLVFEYSNGPKPIVTSIHLSAFKTNEKAGFLNLSFGMNANEVKRAIGPPTDLISLGEYGSRWDYENANYFLEMDTLGKLWGIKLFHIEPTTAVKEMPTITAFLASASKENNNELYEYLSPNLQLLSAGQSYFFLKPWNTITPADPIVQIIRKAASATPLLDTVNLKNYRQSMQLTGSGIPSYTQQLKQSSPIKELQWVYQQGRYRLTFIRIE